MTYMTFPYQVEQSVVHMADSLDKISRKNDFSPIIRSLKFTLDGPIGLFLLSSSLTMFVYAWVMYKKTKYNST